VARRLAADGPVTVVDDRPGSATFADRAAGLEALGVTVVAGPAPERLAGLVAAADLVVPSPGVPEAHPVYDLAGRAGVPLRSEIELAGAAAARRGLPLVAVTGTNGKTTVTTLITEMLGAGGRRAVAAGNIGRPLLDAVHDDDVDVVVAEVSSFQLRFTETFRPRVAVLLNVAEDHLDWHPTFEDYVAAKARIFAARPATTSSSSMSTTARWRRWHVRRPPGRSVSACGRSRDHARRGGWREGFSGLRTHRVAECVAAGPARSPRCRQCVGGGGRGRRSGRRLRRAAFGAGLVCGAPPPSDPGRPKWGVTFVDDSKATNPHAALAALAGFDSVVLLAGGRNKGLDLGVLRAEAGRIRAVVAIGEAADEVEACFEGLRPVRRAGSMAEAVRLCAELAQPGDTVLLSRPAPRSTGTAAYAARGDDFAREVRTLQESRR